MNQTLRWETFINVQWSEPAASTLQGKAIINEHRHRLWPKNNSNGRITGGGGDGRKVFVEPRSCGGEKFFKRTTK